MRTGKRRWTGSRRPAIPSSGCRSPAATRSAASSSAGRVATAVAGAILGVNPFDQPDVEASKVATRRLTAEYEARGGWPAVAPLGAGVLIQGGEILAYADDRQAASLRGVARVGAARRADRRPLRPAPPARLLRLAGLRRAFRRRTRRRSGNCASPGSRCPARGDDGRVRSPLPALHGAGLQGGTEQRRLPAGDVRRRGRPARCRVIRRTFGVREDGAGARRRRRC